ncbi:LAFA_0E05468g1_1 [Lachancea sp. 'fantastica']|nr:LAFA_0E05468g1_1 [Lachancea sp. 'fantastica']
MSDLDALEAEFGRGKKDETRVTATHADSDSFEYDSGTGQSKNQDKDGKSAQFAKDHGKYGSGYGASYNAGITHIPAYEEPTVDLKDWFDDKLKPYLNLGSVTSYVRSLFPFLSWIHHYNLRWLYQDVVAGITVGCVLVPQSMSYAQIATLPPQFGLYSSFIGAFIYSFFATSKDVCIGPVAVMSLQTAKVVAAVTAKLPHESDVTGPIIATALALLCGIIALGLGVLRLGFLVELISTTAVGGFMTGSALNIVAGQVPALMGYNKLVNTRTSTYKVIIESLKHLPDTKLDAAFGLVPLFILYLWKWFCNSGGPKLVDRYCRRERTAAIWRGVFFYSQALRNAIVIIVCTAIAWGISHNKKKAPISLLGKVPSGLKDVGVMTVPEGLLSKLAPELPASVIVLLLEHIAISKAFGRVNDYRVVPDQELIAIGATNLIGTFFNAYPATGSFSRSALKAKCNVSTPLSGLFSGSCVLLAIYCLTSAFRFIPKATLSAVIIHAVSDLVASYKTTWSFYRTNPPDFVCFIVTVFITVFSSIENGIYFAMCWSVAVLLWKVGFPSGQFLGRVDVAEVLNPVLTGADDSVSNEGQLNSDGSFSGSYSDVWPDYKLKGQTDIEAGGTIAEETRHIAPPTARNGPSVKFHTKWVPFDQYNREINPSVTVRPAPPGVIVFRPSESWTYINCSRQYNAIFDEVTRQTRRGHLYVANSKNKRWNDPGEWTPPTFLKKLFKNKKAGSADIYDNEEAAVLRDDRPVLRVIAMDWSQVAQTDATGLQTLVDLRKAVNKYADRQVEFHFSGIISPWIKRGLINVGFGTVNAEHADESLLAGHASYHVLKASPTTASDIFEEEEPSPRAIYAASGTNNPFFHLEMPDFAQWDLGQETI